MFLAVECNNQGAYRELLSLNAEEQLRYQNPKTGNTVLHMACEKRDAEMVRLFCKKGALVNIQNVSSRNIYSLTCREVCPTLNDPLKI